MQVNILAGSFNFPSIVLTFSVAAERFLSANNFRVRAQILSLQVLSWEISEHVFNEVELYVSWHFQSSFRGLRSLTKVDSFQHLS